MASLASYQERSAELLQEMQQQSYYTHLLEPYKVTESYREEYNYWIRFWCALPDDIAIQTGVFCDMCDLMDDILCEIQQGGNTEDEGVPF